jgi:hypothetical protein
MFPPPPPPNAERVADEVVVPLVGPSFRWAVFATGDSPADVIAYYSRVLGRAPDEGGSRWEDAAGHSLAVFAAADRAKVPPSARQHIPPDARTLVLRIERRRTGLGPTA